MTWFVPGRIEVLGKHTDYAGGRSLLVASEQGVTASATPWDNAPVAKGAFFARSSAASEPVQVFAGKDSDLPAGHWGNYVQTVIDRLTLNFGPLRSAQIDVDSTLPLASGMSSSSALIVAVTLAIADHNDLWNRPEWVQNIDGRLDLGAYAATVENGADFKGLKGAKGVGTFGGSQDHTGMLACHEGQLTSFTFSPLVEHESVPVPSGWVFAIAVSGVLAEKTGAALQSYNDVSLRVSKLVEVWNQSKGTSHLTLAEVLGNPADTAEGAAEELGRILLDSPELSARPDLMERLLAYLVEVGEVIPVAEAALKAGDVETFGVVVDRSHQNADQNLHNQVPETNRLQTLARELGAGAASAFGAGFGGSVWALVRAEQADQFAADWLAAYVKEFPQNAQRASILITGAGKPAHRV